MKCPFCAEEIKAKAKVCRYCGRDIPEDAEKKKGSSGAAWFGVLLFLVFMVWLVIDSLSPSQTAQRRSNPPVPSVGAILELYTTNGAIPVGINTDALDQLEKAQMAQDEQGQVQLVASAMILLVPSGTKARLLDAGFFTHEIRILEGRHQGRKGWVRREFVKFSTR